MRCRQQNKWWADALQSIFAALFLFDAVAGVQYACFGAAVYCSAQPTLLRLQRLHTATAHTFAFLQRAYVAGLCFQTQGCTFDATPIADPVAARPWRCLTQFQQVLLVAVGG